MNTDSDDPRMDYDRSMTFWQNRSVTISGHRATALADRVPEYATSWGTARLFTRRMRMLRAHAPYKRVLDIGCGDGRWSVGLAAMAEEVIATDFCPSFVEATRELARVSGRENVVASVQDMREVQVPGPCDLILLGAVTMYIDDHDLARLTARLATEVVAPGGMVYLRASTHAGRTRTAGDGAYQAIYRPVQLYRRIFESHGFMMIEQRLVPEYSYSDLLAAYFAIARVASFGATKRWPALERMLFRIVRSTWPLSLHTVFKLLDLVHCPVPPLRSHEMIFVSKRRPVILSEYVNRDRDIAIAAGRLGLRFI